MASNIPFHIIEEEEEEEEDFDWEAAVIEIDVACQNQKPSTSHPNELYSRFAPPQDCSLDYSNNLSSNNNKKEPGISRQSTLDKFVGKVGPIPQLGKQAVEDRDQDRIEGDEKVSCIDIDAEAAKTWIYPVNVPLRDYQFAITKTALFSNTLVALPTGLGKTLIAAVVMYNYFRWFPDGKIVFAAPSRPLVMQQIEACHNIVGISQEWTIDMTGQINPTKRACFWKTKRVFFVTPQVLEKDIRSGTCLVKYLVCLVIDEAHRALGNYSYCVAVRELMAVPVHLRILALTATPGSKQQTIQLIIDNLHISSLEYRNETDHDVSPYVHNRKIELIEVALGQDAVEVNNRLLEVIRPYVARLCAFGLLQHRDYQTLSPCDLLNSRDKFRQAPPTDLPHNKCGEVEKCFGALITLYHIRKLLSSHGIRPAYDMLEEKMQQGSFARLMSKNEGILTAKDLMQQSLSHGAPSPKLSKMLEVLVDHFKTNDPQKSRVIIFSNFRGSVRDIMNALANIGGLVKATQFIGQSSGKTLKGQSQKVQQAVLEKFRAGGYNVIVATSIGEEGLDIMEVDLVICFDANVSPLRMIQRMGRTGRKHDGRVVVLACEGSELKGYIRKQANSRAIKKHMRNGGMNSFNFHSSPRMIPHIYKPEVQFVELSIEQFIPRGKRLKDDAIQTPFFKEKLTVAETDTIATYFHGTSESSWKPSLIAFPHFQAFPSRVHKVMHSHRTGMLIEMMQRLQGLTFSRDSRTFFLEDEVSSGACLEVDTIAQHDNDKKEVSHSKCERSGSMVLQNSMKQDSCHLKTSDDNYGELTMQAKAIADITTSQTRFIENGTVPISRLHESGAQKEKMLDGIEKVHETPILKRNLLNEGDSTDETLDILEIKAPSLLADEYSNDLGDTELSPRLTNLIKSGFVPESPINDSGQSNKQARSEFPVPDCASPAKLCTERPAESSSLREKEKASMENCACGRNVPVSPVNTEIRTPLLKMNASTRGYTSTSPVAEDQTPPANFTNNSCSEDWCLSSGPKSENVERARKFKRLRKVGDCGKIENPKGMKENSVIPVVNNARTSGTIPIQITHGRGKRKPMDNARAFIEEEAEVSLDTEVSDDEENDQVNNSYDDSFIDDRINPTSANTQAESSRVDMMAIYRRSLLSQSPMVGQPNCSTTFSPDCASPMARISESGNSSAKMLYSLQTPQTESIDRSTRRNSESFQINQERISSEAMSSTTADFSIENEKAMECRKRKLSFYQAESMPAINLEQEFTLQSEAQGKESIQQGQSEKIDANADVLDDDLFFENLDLDAVEAQATLHLKHKSELPMHKEEIIPSNIQNVGLQCSPSFDLGIW